MVIINIGILTTPMSPCFLLSYAIPCRGGTHPKTVLKMSLITWITKNNNQKTGRTRETLATEKSSFVIAAAVQTVDGCSANDSEAVSTTTPSLYPSSNYCGDSLLIDLNLQLLNELYVVGDLTASLELNKRSLPHTLWTCLWYSFSLYSFICQYQLSIIFSKAFSSKVVIYRRFAMRP